MDWTTHRQTSGELTIARFEAGDVTAEDFTHEAHVHVGWLYVREFGEREGLRRFDAALRRLVIALGAGPKYNAMITWLFIKLIADRSRPDEEWTAFLARNRDLIDERPR